MPSVHVYMWPGRSREIKKQLACGITRVFSELRIPSEAVEVIIHEIPLENWAQGGELACDRHPNIP
jgi:4-oxalocrotonate tautomerase family enzyme